MTTLLMITILVLVSIAVWQITKIFQVAQLNSKVDDSQIANEKDNDWNGKLMFAFLVFIYLITIYSFWEWGDVLLPEAASEHGVKVSPSKQLDKVISPACPKGVCPRS